MIRSFRHKGIERFFATGSKAGIQPKTCHKTKRAAYSSQYRYQTGTDERSGQWHSLTGKLAGNWAVSVSGNWRLTFSFDGEDAILVDYQDYH